MNVDIAIAGGGLAGAALGTVLARSGMKVLILERETKFKDRVRGENMMPWGVARARRLGVPCAASARTKVPARISAIEVAAKRGASLSATARRVM